MTNGLFESLPQNAQEALLELEQLNETYEEWLPATLSPKLVEKGVKHKVRLWSVPRTTGEVLYELVSEHEPKTIMELGTSAGYSTIWMALAAQKHGGEVITVDSSEVKVQMAEGFAERAGVDNAIDFVHAAIDDAINAWEHTRPDQKIDMVFFDADKKNYARFYEMLLPHLAPGHVLVADDAIKYQEVMEPFLNQMQSNADYESTLLNQDHGLFIAVYQ